MPKYNVKVWFHTEVEADNVTQVDEAIHTLLDELGTVKTSLNWDDCDWEL